MLPYFKMNIKNHYYIMPVGKFTPVTRLIIFPAINSSEN